MGQTLQSLFGLDLSTGQKWIIAFAVIMVLLVLLGLFARQIKDGRLRIKGQGSGRTRQPRLGVVDTHDLDRQRQLVLIRRDNVEHLIMIGGASDVVVETNILRSGARTAMPAQAEMAPPERHLPFESLVPEPQRFEPADEPRRVPPPAAIAVTPPSAEPASVLPSRPVQSAPRQQEVPASSQVAAVATGAAIATALGVGSSASAPQPAHPVPAPNFARDHAPAPSVSPGELDDMARQLEEALKRPFSTVRGSSNATPAKPPSNPAPADAAPPAPPAPVAPVIVATAAPPAEPEPILPEPIPVEPVSVEPALPPPTPPAPPVTTGRPVSLPSDVEAELEMALGLKPGRIEAKAAPLASVVPLDPPKPPVAELTAEPAPALKPVVEPVPEARSDAPEVMAAETVVAEPEPESDTVKGASADKPTSEEPETKSDAKLAQIDPFSVDAIEAEFARLLGRDPKAKS